MDGARDAVVQLDVEARENVVLNHARINEIAERRLVNNVAHSEALNGLVLGGLASTSVTHDLVRVIATVTVAAVVAPLHSHDGFDEFLQRRRVLDV